MRFQNMLTVARRFCAPISKRFSTIGNCCLLAVPLLQEVKTKVNVPDDLSTRKVVENASRVATEAANTLHMQTALALMDAQQRYNEALEVLLACLDQMIMNMSGGGAENEDLWQQMIEARHNVIMEKNTKTEMEYMLQNTEKLLALAAEISCTAGSEYSAISANERLLSIQTRLGILRKTSDDYERRLNEREARMIEINVTKPRETDSD